MAVGRRQSLLADIPFLTFWGPPRRIYQILVHFLGLTVFLWSAERSKSWGSVPAQHLFPTGDHPSLTLKLFPFLVMAWIHVVTDLKCYLQLEKLVNDLSIFFVIAGEWKISDSIAVLGGISSGLVPLWCVSNSNRKVLPECRRAYFN